MADALPRIVLQTEKFRIVETGDGTKTAERFEGRDAMGDPRWRELRIGEADNISRLFRDWIFAHCATCPALKEQESNE